MHNEVEFKVENNKVIITKSPVILTNEAIEEILEQCFNCDYIVLNDDIEIIGESAFNGSGMEIRDINLSRNLKQISNYAFSRCYITNIDLPNNLVKIGEGAFYYCINLNKIKIPDSVEKLEASAFECCSNLEYVKLSKNLNRIDPFVFKCCYNLKEVVIPNSATIIGEGAFSICNQLKSIVIPNGVKTIDSYAFEQCLNLESIVFPDTLKEIGDGAFLCCSKLKKVYIPNSVEKMNEYAFYGCKNLKEIRLSVNLKKFHINSLSNCTSLEKIILEDNGKVNEIIKGNSIFIPNPDNKFFTYDKKKETYCFCDNGKCIEFNRKLITTNIKLVELIDEMHWGENDFIMLYYWANKKFIPNHIVIKNMPSIDVDKFYVNNNCKEWEKLLIKSKIKEVDNRASFFKLCYVLGVFNEKTSVRDKAVKFIEENIIGKMNEEEIHERFDGFYLKNGFNEEYSKFFMKYFNINDFMITVDEEDEEIDLMAASYNNFSNVKKYYPNKVLNTNRDADKLLPEHVMDAVRTVSYNGVEEGNEEFARVLGRYGYSQTQFNELQKLFNEAKSIDEIDMKLFISDDIEGNIRYALLENDNPLCAVLGNITNCCQVLSGAGEACVKYGMTQPNSKFMTFNYNDTIIGQSWVWYDENSKTICLDNIEVPTRYCGMIKKDKGLQEEFVKCLLRVGKNFIEYMKGHNLEVEHVTIGEGYNDIKYILKNNFKIVGYPNKLSGYNGYSDASKQYEILHRSE